MTSNSSKTKIFDATEETVASKAGIDGDMATSEKQDKFLRLLGGKKEKNAEATSEWMSKSRSVDEEKSLQKGLENQYNTSLNLRLTGKARRHEGIGFEQQASSAESAEHMKDNQKQDSHQEALPRKSSPTCKRSRSRSPLRSERRDDNHGATHCNAQKSGAANTEMKDSKDAAHVKPINKKNFYMQFAKAKESS